MLKTIIYREFLANITTLRFILGFLICIGLVGTNTYVLMQNYADRLQGHQRIVQSHLEEIRNIETYSELSAIHHPKSDKKPKLLSLLNKGVEGRLGSTVQVAHGLVPAFATMQHKSDNPYLVVFPQIDLMRVFQIVISLLTFLFAYNAVAGERENGTLALMLSNSVSRGIVLGAKYLGGMLSLVVLLVISLLTALLIIAVSPYGTISASDWARIGLFCLVSLIYVSVLFTLGLLFSSLTHRTATALMFVMFFWVVFVLIWPSASVFVVSKMLPLKSDTDLTTEGVMAILAQGRTAEHPLLDLRRQFANELAEFAQKRDIPLADHGVPYVIVPPIPAWFDGGQWNRFEGDTYIGRFDGPPGKLFLFHEFFKFREELVIRYADRLGEMRHAYLTQYPIRQAKLVRNLLHISPAGAYANASAILAGTDFESHLRFLSQAKQYRQELIRYLRDQEAFASAAWYNPEAFKKIDTGEIPVFREIPESIWFSIGRAAVDISILVLLNLVFFLLTYLCFLKYNPR